MRTRIFTIGKTCLSLWLPFLPFFVSSQPAAGKTLTGQVINRTISRPVAGCEVTLVRHGVAGATTERDTTDGEGRFRFDMPAVSDSVRALLATAYAGVDYIHTVTPADSAGITLSVYGITDADTAVAVVSHHFVADAQTGRVVQILIVQNSGDRTYRTGEGRGHGLEISLPEGITGIIAGRQELHTRGNTLVDPRPVKPGGSQLVFAVQLPPSRRIVQKVNYPTGAVDVLITPAGARVTGVTLPDLGEVDLGGRRYHRFSATDLKPGDRIEFQIGSAASAGWSFRRQAPWILGGVALGLALLTVFFRAARKGGATGAETETGGQSLRERRDAVMAQIASLDDRFAEGKISEADYQTRRADLKAEAVELTRALDRTEG